MPFPVAEQASDAATSESTINDLLGADLAPAETTEQPSGDTPVTEAEPDVQDEPQTEVVEGEEETPTEGDEPEEGEGDEASEEEDFNLQELETDFADSAYARAAQHYSKQFGKQLDPNDQADRAILRELMERGRKISELQTKEPEETEAEEETTEEAAPAAPTKTPAELFQERLAGIQNYSKESFNPQAAKAVVLPLMQAMANFIWGKDKAAKIFEGRSDADLQELTVALSTAMGVHSTDVVPQMLLATPKIMENQYPFMSRMHETAAKEAALDEVLDAADKNGAPAFPGMDKLIDSGAINRALASPELKDAQFHKDPHKNRVAKLKMAYKIARNERVDPQILAKAAARGRTAEKERQTRVAAGRTSPGSSSRSNVQTRSNFVNSLVSGGGSKSAELFKGVGRRVTE